MSITKTIDYWLPDELWDQVKDYMGLRWELINIWGEVKPYTALNEYKHNMRWDLINKYTTIEDMDEVNILTIDGQEDRKWKQSFNIKKDGSISIHYKNKQYSPKDFQLIKAKKKAFDRRKMTPIRWLRLNNAIIKRIKPFDRLKKTCRFYSISSSSHNHTKYYYEVWHNGLTKTKVKILKYLDADFKLYISRCDYTKKQFNDSFKGQTIFPDPLHGRPEGLRVNEMTLI